MDSLTNYVPKCQMSSGPYNPIFVDLLSSQIDSRRYFILLIFMFLFFTYMHKRNNAVVSYFLKFISVS